MKKVLLASVAVNKAADYVTKADDMLRPTAGARPLASIDDEDVAPTRREKPRSRTVRRPKTTLERLRQMEAGLNIALDRLYERFRKGELTAKDMEQQRDRLIRAFNQQVLSENIRYRSMLR